MLNCASLNGEQGFALLHTEPMHDNGTQTIKAEVVEPISEPQEVCQEEANTSSTHSPSPRTVYTFNDGKVCSPVCFYSYSSIPKMHDAQSYFILAFLAEKPHLKNIFTTI